jgi:4'-phosphopantetheinyl transferase
MLTTTVDIWEGEPADDTPVDGVDDLLSDEERAQARRFAFALHRERFIRARAFVRGVLGHYLRRAPRLLAFGRNRYGKPCLLDNDLDLQFNVSHSGDRVVCIVTEADAVGIDIERLRPIDEAEAIAARFFSSVEQRALATVSRADRARAFLACWTRKEALIKARGQGLACALDAFDVSPASTSGNALLADRSGATADWWIRNVNVGRGWVCAAAIRGALGQRVEGRSVSVELASASMPARVHSIRKYSPRTAAVARFAKKGEPACSDWPGGGGR